MTSIYDFTATGITGEPRALADYRGRVMLIVNTASKCGFTPQYEGLEALHEDYAARGLAVLGFPCNQFGAQEPGDAAEIATFCKLTYDVDFPLTAKTDVKGELRHPFYAWAEAELGEAAEPKWNFHKILIGKDGEALAAFGSRTEPLDPDIVSKVEAAL